MADALPSKSSTSSKAHKLASDERKKKKRKLEDLVDTVPSSNLPSPPVSDASPTISQKARKTSTKSAATKSLATAEVSSPFTLTKASRYLPISPAYSATPAIGIQRDHLDPLVFKYDSTLDGVVLLHQNLQFESPAARILGESPFAFVWCMVEFMLWRPVVGMVLEGYVNSVGPSHIGMLYGNVFSVSVTQRGIPVAWKFIPNSSVEEDEDADAEFGEGKFRRKVKKDDGSGLISGLTKAMGTWTDDEGNEVDGLQKFVVTAVKAEGAMLTLEGSFKDEDLPELDDEVVDITGSAPQITELHGKDDEEEARRRRKDKKKRKRDGHPEK